MVVAVMNTNINLVNLLTRHEETDVQVKVSKRWLTQKNAQFEFGIRKQVSKEIATFFLLLTIPYNNKRILNRNGNSFNIL